VQKCSKQTIRHRKRKEQETHIAKKNTRYNSAERITGKIKIWCKDTVHTSSHMTDPACITLEVKLIFAQ
jgi:hypothetical protein